MRESWNARLQWGRGLKTPETPDPPPATPDPAPGFNGAGVLRPRKPGETCGKCLANSSLQWGRGLKTPETSGAGYPLDVATSLQWGRGLKTPETALRYSKEAQADLLQWGRGLKTPETTSGGLARTAAASGFNGAGVLRPRKRPTAAWPTAASARLQWGRGLKTPETGRAAAVVPLATGFNGAGVLRPRKHALLPQGLCGEQASMGPGS